MANTKIRQILLPNDLWDSVSDEANALKISRASVIRIAISKHLMANKK